MGFELFEQFGNTPPDVIIYPTGGGVGVIAIYKAFQELEGLGYWSPAGILGDRRADPRLLPTEGGARRRCGRHHALGR